MYLCVCRINKLANSQMDIVCPLSSPLEGQRKRRDMKKNRIMPGNYNTPVFSRLNEIATIKFNTGVSTFTNYLNSKFVLGLRCTILNMHLKDVWRLAIEDRDRYDILMQDKCVLKKRHLLLSLFIFFRITLNSTHSFSHKFSLFRSNTKLKIYDCCDHMIPVDQIRGIYFTMSNHSLCIKT